MMKKRMPGILLGVLFCGALVSGCSANKATETANESAEIEKGEDEEAVPKEEKEAEKEKKKEEKQETEGIVGVFLPSDDADERWSVDGQELAWNLENSGYEVRLFWAEDDSSLQAEQMEESLEEGASGLIVAPVDAYGLSEVLEQAKEQKVPVFSYDTLIMNSDAVSYYVTFGTRNMGQLVANAVVEQAGLETAREAKQALSIEFLMGEPQDSAQLFFFNGMMEVLAPYFEDGTLVCPSQKQTFDAVSLVRGDALAVQQELAARLQDFYVPGEVPDIICTAKDAFASASAEFLEDEGILPGSEQWPLITGVGSEAEAVKSVAEGRLTCTVFADNRLLAQKCAEMAAAKLSGEDPEVNDYEQYDNGKKIIGTYACELQLIDAGNYQLLIDNGYYTEEQVEPEVVLTATPVPELSEEPAATPKAGVGAEDEAEDEAEPTEAPETEKGKTV